MKKDDNRGFSLVELIIVIAIMAIVVGMLAGHLNYIGNSQARALANSIKTAVGQTRIQTMGKYETYLHIYKGSDGRYYRETWKRSSADSWTHDKREMIGKNRPTVKYKTKDGTVTNIDGTSNGSLLITFDRSNGKEVARTRPVGITANEEGQPLTVNAVECKEIKVSYGTREYVIKVEPETGKVSL